jgi:sortase A
VEPERHRRAGSGGSPASARRRRRRSAGELALTVIGELLITAGVLVGLFLGWQVWWNNLIVSSQQTSTAQQQSKKWIDDAMKAPRPTPTDPSTPAAVDPPVLAEPAPYQPFAVIYIPRLGPDWKRTIRQTVDVEQVLNSYTAGVGHYPDTQLPGQVGNFAVAGHDSGWGNTFIDLSKLRIGDNVYVQTKDGWYTYQFRNFEYVQPTQVSVIAAVPRHPDVQPIDRLMTITTCNPPFHAGERLIAYTVYKGFAPTAQIPNEIRAAVAGG